MIVLDTNVVSELMRPSPAPAVDAWVRSKPPPSLFVSTVSQAEILYGVMLLPSGKRRRAIEAAAERMFEVEFVGRILPFGRDAAVLFASIAAERRRAGRPVSHPDLQIAAITRASGATLATRNVGDFDRCGIDVVDPWSVD